ncbi:protein kinase subdomain-containing protein [Pseudozyma hubeiensis SY62]|uniref:Protein kinase subdomain-containing protein n=1 Tax=Pseudozyma hubeiensis (strain SY62) TaxID=1305764 RepID=R9P916_PSEHS|nr:protein kinase subdomain-containing protein [Pseudozyma hubeiensis SY62]GAC97868.1 protein kinase subdomain-containing protein [Pseudozyma hubeiensis SY62]
MSAPGARQDASLSAASFLASINAESSTSFGSDATQSAASSAPSLPISAKVALIDAQIDSLETRIEQTITTHAAELRTRAASTRTVDRNFNQLWRSVNQVSSRLVTVGPQIAPTASEYHDALAQSSKQGLLISVLSDLLAATRLLETLEGLQGQTDSPNLKSQLPDAAKLIQPLISVPALGALPAVIELQARFDRLEKAISTSESASRDRGAQLTLRPDPVPAPSTDDVDQRKSVLTSNGPPALSPALKVLEAARAIIVSRGAEAGWKEVRIELDAPAPPPPAISIPAPPTAPPDAKPSRPSMDARPDHLLGDQLYTDAASLTRNSSSSSTTNARNKHRPKLGARVIRPQDQLGSGPFNADDTPLDEDGWGLDDDDDNQHVPASAGTASGQHAVHQPQHADRSVLQHVAALDRHDLSGSPSGSMMMQSSMSSSSSQHSTFAVQEATSRAAASGSNDVDAWGLGDEDDNGAADAWDLDDDDGPAQMPTSPKQTRTPVAFRNENVKSAVSTSAVPAQDAWNLQDQDINDEDDPWEAAEPSKSSETAHAFEAGAKPLLSSVDDRSEVGNQLEESEISRTAPEASGSHPLVASRPQQGSISSMSATAIGFPDTNHKVPHTESSFTALHPQSTHFASQAHQQAPFQEKIRQPIEHVESARQAVTNLEPGPAAVQSETLTNHKEQEADADAWDFEEGSNPSEPDGADLAPITPLKPQTAAEKPAAAPAHAVTAQTEPTAYAEARQSPYGDLSAKPTPEDAQASEAESVSRPSSPSGWGEDFSDPESTSVPASTSYRKAVAQASTRRGVSSTRSVSVDSRAASNAEAKPLKSLPAHAPPIAAAVKEECTISQRSLDLVKLAESTMSSVLSKLQHGRASGEDSDMDDVEALAGSVFKIFELHRALMPVAHGEVLRDVPSLAMQFFNDCEHLARELTRLVGDKGDDIATAWMTHDAEAAKRWKTKELAKLEREAVSTRSLGQRWFEAQMTAQTKILLDTLMEADGFARTFDDHRYARCERCIKQVVQMLQQLGKAWRPVLVASRFHAAIGRLVDLVLQKVLHDVLDLEDIGESESEKIASLVKTLGSLEGLFAADGADQPSVAPLWVPSWFKTSYLIEILTGSLVDIEFLAFEAGALVDYSRRELTGLIRALFADTPNRAKLLRRIESAPVEVLAQ